MNPTGSNKNHTLRKPPKKIVVTNRYGEKIHYENGKFTKNGESFDKKDLKKYIDNYTPKFVEEKE